MTAMTEHVEIIKMSQMEIWKLKCTITEMKNLLERISSRFNRRKDQCEL